jgi:hypothetical protein
MGRRKAGVFDPDRLLLKAFWEAVEKRLAERSANELRAIFGAMAQATALPTEVWINRPEPAEKGRCDTAELY